VIVAPRGAGISVLGGIWEIAVCHAVWVGPANAAEGPVGVIDLSRGPSWVAAGMTGWFLGYGMSSLVPVHLCVPKTYATR
jgi:hypothetical protein